MARYVSERALIFRRTVDAREETFQFNPGTIQEVPDWVEGDEIFDAAIEEGSIHDTELEPSIAVINNPDYDPNRDPSVPDVYRKGEYASRFGDVAKPKAGRPVSLAAKPIVSTVVGPDPLLPSPPVAVPATLATPISQPIDSTPPAVKASLSPSK